MDTKNFKKQYVNLQIKLFNYIKLLDGMLSQYLINPTSISFKKISKLNNTINKILIQNYDLQNYIICCELIA